MGGFKLGEKLPCRAELGTSRVLQVLTNSFRRIGARCDIEQPLIGFGILHHGHGRWSTIECPSRY
jgi:hypothetical protein